ncbi:hypothetical protein B5P44_29510 [Mycobacterium sp. CBMA 213]|nr:hypothetical protein [Mycolicibacterium sp. CBMA 213]
MSAVGLIRSVEGMTQAHVPAPAAMMREWLHHNAQQFVEALSAAGLWVRTRTQWPQHPADYYPPRREESFEEAAMAREMYRL